MSTYASSTGSDIARYDLEKKVLTPIVATPFEEQWPRLSPDERWIAYTSDRSGRSEVYVESVSGQGQAWPVSTGGGELPEWRQDGRELFFYTRPDRIMSVDVPPGTDFRTGPPKELFRTMLAPRSNIAVTADGQRFIVVLAEGRTGRESVTLISDWRPANGR
jgi:hypothetical protein